MSVAALLVVAAASAGEPASIIASPAFQRVDVDVGAVRLVRVAVRSQVHASITAVEADCSCIHASTTLPTALAAGEARDLELRVVGMGSGMKQVTVRTEVGSATVTLQIVTNGIGVGRDRLAAAAKAALKHQDRAVILVHDLHGQLRNCGCSAGSLGGIDRLAALPDAWAALAPGVVARFVLSGDPDGSALGIGAALAEHGWRVGDRAIAVVGEVGPSLVAPGVIAVVPKGAVEVRHRRLVQPPLADGMVAMVLLLDRDGEIDEQHVIPIDQSLPSDPDILSRFPDALTKRVTSVPASDACMACHAGSHEKWATSAHARAWGALTPANRTDGCVTCHSTPVDDDAITGGVHCQDCHPGTAAHAANPTAVHLGAAVDCRTCHDSRHHPEFDRVKAWDAIVHGR